MFSSLGMTVLTTKGFSVPLIGGQFNAAQHSFLSAEEQLKSENAYVMSKV